MSALHHTDFTPYSAVIVCKRADCPWRCGATDRRSAWRLYAAHCRYVHQDWQAAAAARRYAGAPNYVS